MRAKQELFLSEYLRCFNAAAAARHAGYAPSNARDTGCRLLEQPEIKQRVKEHIEGAAMSASEVLYHLSIIARGDDFEVSARLKALELLGKAAGVFDKDNRNTMSAPLEIVITEQRASVLEHQSLVK